MQDSIIAYYLLGLKKHALINNHNAASSLMEEISKLSTVEGLIALFSAYLNSEEARYETLSLNSQLLDWKKELEQLKLDQQHALTALAKIPTTPKNKNLLLFLKEIISDPSLQLHIHMSSMLNILCNNPIPELIDYVIRLPTAPKPKLGAVATLTAKSKQHAECLILLNNLTSASKAKGPLWECTNTLLKLSLIMYQELALIEVSLDDEEQIEKACCAVM